MREERPEHLPELPPLIPQHKLYEAYFGQMKETIDWLESHGIVFADVIAIGAGPKIWHVYDKGNDASPGGHFMQCFGAEAERLGTEARFNTFGRQLIMENGKVAGLLAEDEKGNVIKVEALVDHRYRRLRQQPRVPSAVCPETKNEHPGAHYGVPRRRRHQDGQGRRCRYGRGARHRVVRPGDSAGAITATWITHRLFRVCSPLCG